MSGVVISVGRTGFYLPLEGSGLFEEELLLRLQCCSAVEIDYRWNGELKLTHNKSPINLTFANHYDLELSDSEKKSDLENTKKELEDSLAKINKELDTLGQ